MRHSSTNTLRVLAINPYSKGFGFAILEGPERLIDYGVKKVRGDKNRACLKKVTNLINRYQPDVITLQDSTGKGSRRGVRIQKLTQGILRLALQERIKERSFSRVQITKTFSSSGVATKHQVATSIVKQLPELAFRLPPPRKSWMSEDERMSIFDATALALTLLLYKED